MSDVALSKELVRIVRHGKHGLPMDSSGFVAIDDIIPVLEPQFGQQLSFSDIQNVVGNNNKKRFELENRNERWMLKATQGHTVKVDDLGLVLIRDPRKYPTVVHGTRMGYWQSIQSGGLKRMKRTHIHFAIGMPGDRNVISGMPAGCDVAIYIDMDKAIGDGLEFYESSNKVILSEGDHSGKIPSRYFKKVINIHTGSSLL